MLALVCLLTYYIMKRPAAHVSEQQAREEVYTLCRVGGGRPFTLSSYSVRTVSTLGYSIFGGQVLRARCALK